MKTTIKQGDRLFFLHRGTHAIHDMNQVVLGMTIIEKDGKLKAIEDDKPFPRGFVITPKQIEKSNNHPMPYYFATREEAEAQFHKEVDREAQAILDKPVSELIHEFYRTWVGEDPIPTKVHDAMKQKIKSEFGVDVDADES